MLQLLPSSVSTHTNSIAALASRDHLLPEHVDLDAEERATWRAFRGDERSEFTKRLRADTPVYWMLARLCREGDRSDPLAIIDRVIMWSAAAGLPEDRARLVELHVRQRIDQVYAGRALPKPEQLDQREQQLDGEEDELQVERLLARASGRPIPVSDLVREAEARTELAAIELTEARSLQREARVLEFRGGAR